MISQQTIDDVIKTHDIQLLIFDCDGTLMETLSLHYQAWRDAFVSHGLSFIDEEEFIREYAGVSGGRMVSAVIAKLNYAQSIFDSVDFEILQDSFTRSPLHAIQFLVVYAGLNEQQG